MHTGEPACGRSGASRSAAALLAVGLLLLSTGCLGGPGGEGAGRDPGYLRIEELNESERRMHLDETGPMAESPEVRPLNRTPYDRRIVVEAIATMEGDATNVQLDRRQADEFGGVDTDRYSYVVYRDRYYWIRYLRNDTAPATR